MFSILPFSQIGMITQKYAMRCCNPRSKAFWLCFHRAWEIAIVSKEWHSLKAPDRRVVTILFRAPQLLSSVHLSFAPQTARQTMALIFMSRSSAGMACEARWKNITFWFEKMLRFARNAAGPSSGWGKTPPTEERTWSSCVGNSGDFPSKDILHATNLFRSEPSQQFVRIQAKSVLQNVASGISSWTRRHGKMNFRVWCDLRLVVSEVHGPRRRWGGRSWGRRVRGCHRGARLTARRWRLRLKDPSVKHTRVHFTSANYDAVSVCVCVFWGISVQRLVQRGRCQLATTSRCAYLFFDIVCFSCF